MNPSRVLTGLFLLLLGAGIGYQVGRLHGRRETAPPAGPPPAGAPAAAEAGPGPELACEVSASFEGNIFPSLVLSLGAAIPEYARCLTIALRHARPGRSYEVKVESALFQRPLDYSIRASSSVVVANPDLPWNYTALRRNAQSQPALFAVTVIPGAGRPLVENFTAVVHPVNEAVTRVYDQETDQWDDTSVCLAGFVNEDHPWIASLLQDAEARTGLQRFTGYELGAASVAQQMQAIWDALAARGLSYVDIATTSGGVSEVSTQYVRFLDQSIQDRGANCVDGAVLLASIFRRIGLRPVLVFRPGHCLVAVHDSAAGGQLVAIEATYLGAQPFSAAVAAGGQELQALSPNLGQPGFSTVDIAAARAEGVRPIGFEADSP